MITFDLVRGYAQRACQVDESTNQVVLTSKDESVLTRIQRFLLSKKIRCTVGAVNDRYRLRIARLDALKLWRDRVGFMDTERAKKLDRMIEKMEDARS